MGGAESRDGAEAGISAFPPDEEALIKQQYGSISVSKAAFQKNLSALDTNLSESFLRYLSGLGSASHRKKDVLFSFAQFKILLAKAHKGTLTDKASILAGLCCSNEEVKPDELYQTVSQLVVTYRNIAENLKLWSSWTIPSETDQHKHQFTLSLLFELFTRGHNKKEGVPQVTIPTDVMYTESDLEFCLSSSPMFMQMFSAIFIGLFPLETDVKILHEKLTTFLPIPEVTPDKFKTILDPYSLTYLNFNLIKDQQSEWRLLFSNNVFGDSYTQLVAHILNKGPSLLIVKEKNGNVFGGYNSQKWEFNSKFYGSSDCFLFTLSPQYGIFTSTTYNSNFVYLNQGQQTLPNGLGMGGQFEYFGLWIDHSFNNGHSKAKPRCTTYGSPQLSKDPEFEVDAIEVWEVGPKPKSDDSDEEDGEKKKKSILDKDPEAKAMLALIGKEQVSLGLREDDEEELTEEMKKKMNVIPSLM